MTTNLDILNVAIDKYLVAPLNAFGIGGFVFDSEGDSVATLGSDITDHYTEDNRALQDHIAIRPVRIILRGYVGELVYRPNGGEPSFTQRAVQKLTTVNAYLPELSAAAQQIQESVDDNAIPDITLSSASNIYGLVKNAFGGVDNGENQANAYAYFKALQKQAILMGIQTPWEFLTNMAIETVIAIQSEDTRTVTDFAVTFKQIRIASTQTLAFTAGNTTKQGAAAAQGASEQQIGQVQGVNLPYRALQGAQGIITGVSGFLSSSLSSIWEAPAE